MAKIVTLTWKGEDYTLNENEAFLAADAVEEFITLGELFKMRTDGNRIRFAKVAQAYSAMLGEAGCRVTPQEVHKAFTDAMKSEDAAGKLQMAIQAIDWLIMVLTDGANAGDAQEDKEQKNEGTSAS